MIAHYSQRKKKKIHTEYLNKINEYINECLHFNFLHFQFFFFVWLK